MRSLRLLVGFGWMRGLVLGGTSSSLALSPWLLQLLAGSLTVGLLLIFLCMRSLPSVSGRLRFRALSLFIQFGVLVGLIRLIGLLPLLQGFFQGAWDVQREELEVVPHELVQRLRAAYDRSSVDEFWSAWSTGAEQGLFRAYCRAGGPVAGNPRLFLGRGKLRVCIRRLGGRSAGGSCSSGLHRVSRGDAVDTRASQHFGTSSLAPVLLLRRRIKAVADVLKGIRQRGFSQATVDAFRWSLVIVGSLLIHMVFPLGYVDP